MGSGTEGLLFAPYLAGERTPHADPNARGAFTGLSVRHDRGALWRAMLEGVAYGLRDSLELLRELGVQPEVGRVSGGGARSDLWLRIVSSVLGLPLERTESEEGSAFGAALLAGVRAGVFADADDAVSRCVRVRDRVEPDQVWSTPTSTATSVQGPLPGSLALRRLGGGLAGVGGVRAAVPRLERDGQAVDALALDGVDQEAQARRASPRRPARPRGRAAPKTKPATVW